MDRGKRGAKRSLMTEAAGVPVAVVAAGANERDLKLARATVESLPDAADRPPVVRGKPQGLCLDKDYDYAEVYALCAAFGFTAHVVARGTEAAQLKRSARKRARRWAVERTHSWMNRFRGILVRWSKRADNYLAMLHFVCALITLRCAGLSG